MQIAITYQISPSHHKRTNKKNYFQQGSTLQSQTSSNQTFMIHSPARAAAVGSAPYRTPLGIRVVITNHPLLSIYAERTHFPVRYSTVKITRRIRTDHVHTICCGVPCPDDDDPRSVGGFFPNRLFVLV